MYLTNSLKFYIIQVKLKLSLTEKKIVCCPVKIPKKYTDKDRNDRFVH